MFNACVPDIIITVKQTSTAINSGLCKKTEKMPEIYLQKMHYLGFGMSVSQNTPITACLTEKYRLKRRTIAIVRLRYHRNKSATG